MLLKHLWCFMIVILYMCRAGVEDAHGKNLSKLHKQIHHVSDSTIG